jgi:hypothetical protein
LHGDQAFVRDTAAEAVYALIGQSVSCDFNSTTLSHSGLLNKQLKATLFSALFENIVFHHDGG